MREAALATARRGWAVFPCRERDETIVIDGKERVLKAKSPYTRNGLKDASADEAQILAWWRRWPNAMVGVPLGINGCFVVDFDPRVEEVCDSDTGEVTGTREWTLDQMKGDLEALIGIPFPPSLTSRTPSGGVHVWVRQPDDGGPEVRNSVGGKALTDHIDVRGAGGYVVVAPSWCEGGADACEGAYRWIERTGDWTDDAAIVAAPAELLAVLRAGKRKDAAKQVAAAWRPPARVDVGQAVDDVVRRYALSALDRECQDIARAPSGQRNDRLNEAAFKVATLVAAGALSASVARASVEDAARSNPGSDDDGQLLATIESGWTAGLGNPRDLAEIAASSRARRERGPPRRSHGGSPPAPGPDDDGKPSSRSGGVALEVGRKGFGGEHEARLTRECAFLPHTDLGNLERFLKRHGRDFLFVEQWGWLAWDGHRWNRDMAVSLLGRAIQDTMRSIQEEAELIRASGIPDDVLPMWDAEQKRAHEEQQRGRFDRVVKVARGVVTLLSDTIAKWGRTSEGAGHISCITKMAEARRSARPDDFDADPLLFNVENGTLVFTRPADGRDATAELRPARRRDLITKIAAAAYDPGARCARYDAFLGEVQPEADMRAFLDCWGGYNLLGLADAQKMVLNYGQGANGKSVDTDVKAHILGDYARVCGIETFIDQGKYRKGSDASPDLAALAGRRMVRASEPEEGSKFSDGLIKAMTGSEPMPVRELMKPPFEMRVTFKVTVSANNKPKIGTDHGIQRRMQLVPWDVIIPDDRQDAQLTGKLKAEASGILNRLVAGACAYLTAGLPMPQAIKDATREYQEENDILGQFLTLCIVRESGRTMGATPLHQLFAAWQTWAHLLPATGKAWSAKHLNAQMQRKGYTIRKSSSMVWDDIAALYDPHNFVDGDGKPVTAALYDPHNFVDGDGKPVTAAPPPPRAAGATSPDPNRGFDDDDLPP